MVCLSLSHLSCLIVALFILIGLCGDLGFPCLYRIDIHRSNVCFRYDSEGDDKSPVMSVSYRWDPSTTSFTDRTVIDVSRASDVQHFEAEGKHFIIATSSTAERGESYSTVPQILKIFQVTRTLQVLCFCTNEFVILFYI